MLHQLSTDVKIILSKDLREFYELQKYLALDTIGVVYDLRYEQFGKYVPAFIPAYFDALIFLMIQKPNYTLCLLSSDVLYPRCTRKAKYVI
ncbi:hypothetical protein [Pontibacter vulgaris]|uniref:hypothetical protein n=1 Tax=Pontibacter vulgaris TaxID=2905679 RepID=UPI001FA6CE5A|nr:hypothetical protein [Pontibacter vulgaris]